MRITIRPMTPDRWVVVLAMVAEVEIEFTTREGAEAFALRAAGRFLGMED